MRVMPIWTVERNLLGLSVRLSTFLAVRLPFLASAVRLDFLALMRATSLMEKRPLSRISRSIINISIQMYE